MFHVVLVKYYMANGIFLTPLKVLLPIYKVEGLIIVSVIQLLVYVA